MAAYPLIDLPKAFKIPAVQVDGTDVKAVHRVVSEAVGKIRQGAGPQFIETHTVRWPGSESNWPVVPVPTSIDLAWDVGAVPERVREWYRASDPVLMFVRDLVQAGAATRGELAAVEQSVSAAIEAGAKFAVASPYPRPEDALTDVFA
jgi:TPP-dependent pyruvate/acetoin dehydrogenase alpha subunit